MTVTCPVCLSPYREEVMRLWDNRFPRRMIYDKYKPLIWGKQSLVFRSFINSMYDHEKHKNPSFVVVQTKEGTMRRDAQSIANMVTELYSQKLENMDPDEISTRDYVSVNKLVLDEKKLKLDEKEQMLAIAKLFGLPEIPTPIKGEEIHDELGPAKDAGDQQESP